MEQLNLESTPAASICNDTKGDRIPPSDDVQDIAVQVPLALGNAASYLKRGTEFLIDNNMIHVIRDHYPKYRRFVRLESDTIFSQLVTLYRSLLTMQWQHFHRFMTAQEVPVNTAPQLHAARVYISMWFRDLYYHNREAVKKLSSVAFSDKYYDEIPPVSQEYDDYMNLLLASIRPTHITGASEDTMYIPFIADKIDFSLSSPFGITNYVEDEGIFYGMLDIMKERKHWNISHVSDNISGRPCWLFDWHSDDKISAWFPMENNFNMEDATLAYIIGDACTPKLGPKDKDDWQFFAHGIVPQNPTPKDYRRVDEQTFHGTYEVITMETQPHYTSHDIVKQVKQPPAKAATTSKRKKTAPKSGKEKALTIAEGAGSHEPQAPTESADQETEEEPEIATPRFRLMTWVYYYGLCQKIDHHTRTGALRIISHN